MDSPLSRPLPTFWRLITTLKNEVAELQQDNALNVEGQAIWEEDVEIPARPTT